MQMKIYVNVTKGGNIHGQRKSVRENVLLKYKMF